MEDAAPTTDEIIAALEKADLLPHDARRPWTATFGQLIHASESHDHHEA